MGILMSTMLSTNMNLPVPSVGSEAGPDYAYDINSCLTLIDQHDHSPGYGVQITPSGLNINTDLSFNDNFGTSVGGMTFTAQGSTPANNTIYESGVDLYYVDGDGNNVRITQSGAVAGSPGSISNLTAPASASYVSGNSTFVWESNTSIAANMDFGAAIMRNLSPNSTFALTLQPPASLSSNFTITLPTIPGSTSFLTLDNSGNMSASISTTGGITGSNIASTTITGGKLANQTITSTQIANSTITTTQISDTAGILPGQTDSLTSGDYYTLSSSSGSFSTQAASLLFTIPASSVTAGAVYTNNGNNYTVVNTISGSTTLTCSNNSFPKGIPQASGTLTKSSGTGPSTIAYTSVTIGTTVTNLSNVATNTLVTTKPVFINFPEGGIGWLVGEDVTMAITCCVRQTDGTNFGAIVSNVFIERANSGGSTSVNITDIIPASSLNCIDPSPSATYPGYALQVAQSASGSGVGNIRVTNVKMQVFQV